MRRAAAAPKNLPPTLRARMGRRVSKLRRRVPFGPIWARPHQRGDPPLERGFWGKGKVCVFLENRPGVLVLGAISAILISPYWVLFSLSNLCFGEPHHAQWSAAVPARAHLIGAIPVG